MAAYPSGNPGAFPFNPSSPVGQFRVFYGDTHSTPYTPPQPGFQNYEELSDAEIEGFLAAGAGSMNRAVGYYYTSLAGAAAKASKSVKDYDLLLDTTKRAADLRAIAQMWFDLADQEDLGDAEDAFEIVPTGTGHRDFIPEASIPQWGRAYTWKRWR